MTCVCKHIHEAQECKLLNGPFGNVRTMAGWPQPTASGLWGPRATRGVASKNDSGVVHYRPSDGGIAPPLPHTDDYFANKFKSTLARPPSGKVMEVKQ